MKTEFLVDLSRNLQSLIDQTGLSIDDYAEQKKIPKKMLEGLLASNPNCQDFVANLALLVNKLGIPAAQLLSPNFSAANSNQFSVAKTGPPAPDHLLARQLGRLIEDFVECNDAGRFEVTALAQELAEEQLRLSGRQPAQASPR